MRPRAVALPMYPLSAAARHGFGEFLLPRLARAGFAPLPPRLVSPGDPHRHWLRPDLALSQTCGYPLVTELAGRVQLLGGFAYSAPGCSGVHYRSVLLVRADYAGAGLADLRGAVAVYNDRRSQSGYNALRAAIAPLACQGRFFSASLASGSHLASARMVAAGAADIAAVDCVSYALLRQRHPRWFAGLRVIGATPATPGLPLISARQTRPRQLEDLCAMLDELAHSRATRPLRRQLGISGFQRLTLDDYQVCLQQQQMAARLGVVGL